jgi:hypothetical protein
MAASMFMNSNSLPIALMQSLVVSVHGLKWTPDDNKNAMLGRALTYLVLYSTLGMMVRYLNFSTFPAFFGNVLGHLSLTVGSWSRLLFDTSLFLLGELGIQPSTLALPTQLPNHFFELC